MSQQELVLSTPLSHNLEGLDWAGMSKAIPTTKGWLDSDSPSMDALLLLFYYEQNNHIMCQAMDCVPSFI